METHKMPVSLFPVYTFNLTLKAIIIRKYFETFFWPHPDMPYFLNIKHLFHQK